MAPGPATSVPHPGHKVYPYRLRGVTVGHPGHVWSTDVTYIRLAHGFVYLVAVIDWYSRYVLAWQVSNSMDTTACAKRWNALGRRRSSTATRGLSSPAGRSRTCSRKPV